MKHKIVRLGLVLLIVLLVIASAHNRKPAAEVKKPVAVCGKPIRLK